MLLATIRLATLVNINKEISARKKAASALDKKMTLQPIFEEEPEDEYMKILVR